MCKGRYTRNFSSNIDQQARNTWVWSSSNLTRLRGPFVSDPLGERSLFLHGLERGELPLHGNTSVRSSSNLTRLSEPFVSDSTGERSLFLDGLDWGELPLHGDGLMCWWTYKCMGNLTKSMLKSFKLKIDCLCVIATPTKRRAWHVLKWKMTI